MFGKWGITARLLLIPVVAAVQLLFSLAVAIALGALNVFYRDVGNLARHILRLAFYASPGIYSIDLILGLTDEHPLLASLLLANPFTILFTAYRDLIYEGRAPEWLGLLAIAAGSLLFLAFATWFFKRVEPSFAKVL